MNTYCAFLVADSFRYERDFKFSMSVINQSDFINTFISTSRYLDNLLDIKDPLLKIDLSDLQLHSAKSFDTEASILDLDLFITNGIVSSKFYDK